MYETISFVKFIYQCNNIFVIASAFDLNTRSHWLNRGHVDEFKSNVPWLVNISKIALEH